MAVPWTGSTIIEMDDPSHNNEPMFLCASSCTRLSGGTDADLIQFLLRPRPVIRRKMIRAAAYHMLRRVLSGLSCRHGKSRPVRACSLAFGGMVYYQYLTYLLRSTYLDNRSLITYLGRPLIILLT